MANLLCSTPTAFTRHRRQSFTLPANGSLSMLSRGFTLLEMMASLLVLALLVGSFYAPRVLSQARELQRAQALVTAEQINRIGTVAQDWTLSNNGNWPDQQRQCGNLFALLRGQLRGLEANAAPASPWRQAGQQALPITHSNWRRRGEIGRYYPSCSAGNLQIEVFMHSDDVLWAHYIRNRLAGAQVDRFHNRQYVRLRAHWPLPAAIPAFASLVSKSQPELTGAMRSNIDLGGHAVLGANDVILNNGHSLGKTVSYANNVIPNRFITTPRCAPGLRPQALASFNRLLHRSGKPINFSAAIVEPMHRGNINRWRVRSHVIDSSGTVDNNNRDVRINVIVRCS